MTCDSAGSLVNGSGTAVCDGGSLTATSTSVLHSSPLVNRPKEDGLLPCQSNSSTQPESSTSGSCNFNFGTFVLGGSFEHYFPDVDFGAF